MSEMALRLRLAGRALRRPEAWLATGAEPERWLAQLGDLAQGEVELYVLPESRQERRAAGLLVIPAAGRAARGGPGLLPLGRVGNLYLPVDAELWPPASEREVVALLHLEVNVLHPAIGLVGWGRNERLRVAHLLGRPVRRQVDWGLARPGVLPGARLVAVMPVVVPAAGDILEEGREDIGERPLDEAPKRPGESAVPPLLRHAGKAPLAVGATLLQKLAEWLKSRKKEPPTPSGMGKGTRAGSGSSVGGRSVAGMLAAGLASAGAKALQNLTPRQFAALAAAMEERRNREIHRLLSLLERNPEEGLKYAIPFGGGGGRGLTMPSGQLGPRDVNFNLSRLGGGGAADPWSIPPDMQIKLREHYRRLATREMALGRFRRAAYIFAHLLNDLGSAANALKQGGHYREAAVLYKERLGNKLGAADCLREGGLLVEAIALYEELGMHERVGDLYTQLEQPERAEASYRKAVQQMIAARQHLKAAAFLENRLKVPREALAVLDAAGDDRCTAEAFGLLGRLRDFAEAQGRIRRYRGQDRSPEAAARVAEIVAEVAVSFPEEATQRLAADTAKVVVGEALAGADCGQAGMLTRMLPRLAPADRLLPRDVTRFVQRKKPPVARVSVAPPKPVAPRRKVLRQVPVVRTWSLPREVQWQAFATAGNAILGVGWQQSKVVGVLCDFWGTASRLHPLMHIEPDARRTVCLAFGGWPQALGIVSAGVGTIRSGMVFGAANGYFQELRESWLPGNALAVAFDEEHSVWVLHHESGDPEELVLSVYDPRTGNLVASHAVERSPMAEGELEYPVPFLVRGRHVYFTRDNHLFMLGYAKQWRVVALGRRPTHLAASDELVRARVALGLEEGGVVYTNGVDSEPVAEGMDCPLLGFTRGGILVATTRSEARVYTFADRRPEYLHSMPGLGIDATMRGAALLPTSNMDELAVVSPTGQVQVITPRSGVFAT